MKQDWAAAQTAFLTGDRAKDARNVTILLDTIAAVTANTDLDSLKRSIVDKALAVTNAERGLLLLKDAGSGQLKIEVARDKMGNALPAGLKYSQSIPKKVFETGKAETLMDAAGGSDVALGQSILDLRLISVMCAPLSTREETLGVLYVDSKASAQGFTKGDLELFTTLGSQCGLAIHNAELIEARIRYLVEEAGYFEHDFLAVEGLVDLDRFSAMYGIYGLAEAVDILMEGAGREGHYGHDQEANELSYRITRRLKDLVQSRPMPYCEGNGGRCFLHSQSGIDTDLDVTAGTRIPIGDEPEMFEHITSVAPHHDLFEAGVSDIFHVEDTARRNPEAMVDIIRGAFSEGMRDFTFNLATNGFIRITGYLVRKCDVERFDTEGARHGSTVFAAGSVENSHVTDRSVKRVLVHEQRPRASQ